MLGPFMICSTVTAGEKGSSGSSLGVSRKDCGVPSPARRHPPHCLWKDFNYVNTVHLYICIYHTITDIMRL